MVHEPLWIPNTFWGACIVKITFIIRCFAFKFCCDIYTNGAKTVVTSPESRLKVLNYTSCILYHHVLKKKKCWFYIGMSDGRVKIINFIEFLSLSIHLKISSVTKWICVKCFCILEYSDYLRKSVWTVSVQGWANCILVFHREPFLVENYWQSMVIQTWKSGMLKNEVNLSLSGNNR